jgi:hypothetical protein
MHRLAFAFIGGALFFAAALYWVVFGFGLMSSNVLYAYHLYDLALPGIGIHFVVVILAGVGAEISFSGLRTCFRETPATPMEQ